MGEKNIFNKLFVMDNISGLADRSNEFANVLTVGRKFSFTPLYIFHTIYPSRFIWQMIILQKKILNIFTGSLQTSSVAKILSSYCNRHSYDCISYRDLWINRMYLEISNSNEKNVLQLTRKTLII